LYGTDHHSRRGVAHVLSRPTGTIGGQITAFRARNEDLPSPREVRETARLQRWQGLRAVAALEGLGCLEPMGANRPALLPAPRVAIRRAPGRDAMLQAIVLKNFGAREVLFEYDRADWLAASPDLAPEDLGIAPVWVVAARTSRSTAGPLARGAPRSSSRRTT
jgi:hypothetical protein